MVVVFVSKQRYSEEREREREFINQVSESSNCTIINCNGGLSLGTIARQCWLPMTVNIIYLK